MKNIFELIYNLAEKNEKLEKYKTNYFVEKMFSFYERIAIIYQDKKFTYGDLLKAISKYGFLITNENIKEGEVVAIVSDYSFDAIALFFALMFNKNIIVPITSCLETEIHERIEEGYVEKVIFFERENLKIEKINKQLKFNPFIDKLKKELKAGLILFSSGSIGKPKAMLHDLDKLIEVYKNKKPKNLTFVVFLMFDHIGGLNTLFNVLSMGGTLVIPEKREPDYICSLIEKYKINILPTSPTFLNLLMMSKAYQNYDLSSLKMITYGTEPMSEKLLKELKKAFPKVRFFQTFGTSETGIVQTFSKSSISTFFKIDDPNIEYKIVEGELWIRSKTQVLGYLNAPMIDFTKDGWFKTGDLVELTGDGYFKIVGRKKEIINVGGLKVFPQEVEEVILQIPFVKDCIVYGEKSPIMGQIVCADVLIEKNIAKREAGKEIKKYCQKKIDTYKIPVKINSYYNINDMPYSIRFKKKRIKEDA